MPGPRRQNLEPIPDALLKEAVPRPTRAAHAAEMRRLAHVAMSRARQRLVLAYPERTDRGAAQQPSPFAEEARAAVGGEWEPREEELFGPAETLQSTFRLLRDELLTTVAAGRRAARRAALRHRPRRLARGRALPRADQARGAARAHAHAASCRWRRRCRRSTCGCCRPRRPSSARSSRRSALDEYLLDAERDERLRARAVAARNEPSLEPFLPRRGDGLLLSRHRHRDVPDVPAEVQVRARLPDPERADHEPAVRDPRPPGAGALPRRLGEAGLPELLGLLEAGWRRGGFGDCEEERQFRAKATQALVRYHDRFQQEDGEPVWFERAFQFRMGPHLLRGRVDRVDRLPGRRLRADRLQDRPPEDAGAAARGRPALAVRGRRARVVAARGRPAGLLLRARRREGAGRALRRGPRLDHRDGADRRRRASRGRASSRRRRGRPARCATTGSPAPPPSAERAARSPARRARSSRGRATSAAWLSGVRVDHRCGARPRPSRASRPARHAPRCRRRNTDPVRIQKRDDQVDH